MSRGMGTVLFQCFRIFQGTNRLFIEYKRADKRRPIEISFHFTTERLIAFEGIQIEGI